MKHFKENMVTNLSNASVRSSKMRNGNWILDLAT